jgi:hypothetical protein
MNKIENEKIEIDKISSIPQVQRVHRKSKRETLRYNLVNNVYNCIFYKKDYFQKK